MRAPQDDVLICAGGRPFVTGDVRLAARFTRLRMRRYGGGAPFETRPLAAPQDDNFGWMISAVR
jgi:hypothetical protein